MKAMQMKETTLVNLTKDYNKKFCAFWVIFGLGPDF